MEMSFKLRSGSPRARVLVAATALAALASRAEALQWTAGNLLVTTSTYSANASLVTAGVTQLPGKTAGQTVTAVANGSYSQVFNNESVDPSFGVTTPITVEQLTPAGVLVSTTSISGAVTSFPSKSEMGLNLSSDGSALTFMGYIAPSNTLDVSNANTSGLTDPTNPVTTIYNRAVITLLSDGASSVTPVWAYSGNNGRNAVLANGNYYMVGNAGNSGTGPSNATLDALSADTGVQMIAAGAAGATTVVGAFTNTSLGNANGDQYGFSITQLGYAADKTGKDDNFRGETLYNNTLYVTKGSGSNGVNTVYQVGVSGVLPSTSTASSTTISVLPGFSTILAKSTTGQVYHPFGLFFANPTTLYVADEGNQATSDEVGGSTFSTNPGGLQKWSLIGGTWVLDYTLTNGLNLGQAFTVSGSVTDSTGSVTSYTDGLRNIAGTVNGDGTVTIYAITSTVGGLVDAGADPNQLVVITDNLGYTSLAQSAGESFTVLQTAAYGQVLRGVQLVPTVAPVSDPASVSASATSVGIGGSSTLTATPTGTGPFTYQWYAGSSGDTSHPVSGATGSSFTTPGLSTSTTYWVQITTASGIVENSPSVTITVNSVQTVGVPAMPTWASLALGFVVLGLLWQRVRKPV